MTIRRFVEYMTKHMDGTIEDDATYRGYELLYCNTPKRVKRALQALGYTETYAFDLFARDLAAFAEGPATLLRGKETIGERLAEWYIWERIKAGQVRRWPYRKGVKDGIQ
jgi:hypothetical protein